MTRQTRLSFMFQDFFDFVLHVLVVGALPINSAAAGTKRKTRCMFTDERGDKILGDFPGDHTERDVAFETASVGRDFTPEMKSVQDLADLLFPLLAGHEKALHALRFLDQGCIAGKQGAVFVLRDGQKLVILNPREKENIKTQDLEPPGQLPEHAIDDEFHKPSATSFEL
jgi:hypothetical protein